MAESLSGVNGQIIRWARELYNIAPEEMSKKLHIDISRYLDWESGKEYPTYAQLKKISEILKKPSAIFFFPEPPQYSVKKGDMRTLPDIVVKGFSKNVIMQFERARSYQLDLEELYGVRPSFFTRRELLPDNIGDLCQFLRKRLDFSVTAQKAVRDASAVFEIFRDKLYDIGVYVFKDAFQDNNISGICVNDDYYPVIIINNSMSFPRQNFTLFHEFYHLVLNTNGAEIVKDDYYAALNDRQTEEEKMCDRFSNSFLMPLDDFADELRKRGEISEELISELSTIYSVSKEAIMYKLNEMGKISKREYAKYKNTFYGDLLRGGTTGRAGNRGNYYSTKLTYLGKRYTREVLNRYYTKMIDIFKASELLRCKVDQVDAIENRAF